MQNRNIAVQRMGLLIVLSGPSGVGKDSVIASLEKIEPNIKRCTTATTRKPRQGETDGLDYKFLSRDEFLVQVADGGFLEYAEVHCCLYGTPRETVEKTRATGTDVLLKIDVQGGLAVKHADQSAVMVFLTAPSKEELERRLRARGTESEDDIRTRITNASVEMAQISEYDYLVVNNTVDAAAEIVRAIIVAERCRIRGGE